MVKRMFASNGTDPIGEIYKDSVFYPKRLSEIQRPPEKMYYQGDISLAGNEKTIAIVGSRRASAYGKWAAYHLAKNAASNGITIISGMATGIDSAAHRGALDGNGKTIAVLGCGVDVCYPSSNNELMNQIKEKGLLISEYPLETPPKPFHFPNRNRIISGLSMGVVVAEAGLNSGSLITAECAADQGKEVFAVPANINTINGIGTNKLIQDGAIPIVVLDDLLTFFGIKRESGEDPANKMMGNDERRLVQIIKEYGEISIDRLSRLGNMSVSQTSAIVTILEMKGILNASLGKIFIAK